jgi:epoxyqueuosine reductase
MGKDAGYAALAARIKQWGAELGFQAVGIADTDLAAAENRLGEWLGKGWHGEMDYMARHGALRSRPAELVPGTVRVISCRMDYLQPEAAGAPGPLDACIARYARGRDYHKVLRTRLQKLCERIAAQTGDFGYRVFADSAPVMEVELAARAGIGWRGKHTLLLSREAGSWFFLGEVYTSLPLPVDAPATEHCGTCAKCIEVCPTQAIRGPYQLDARRCISYLTIELKGSIPEALRPLIGNRVYGCDDCQAVCPWNSFARPSTEPDFAVRNGLDRASLVELFSWSAEDFGARMAGSPIRRIGYERWLRNLAVGLGNAPGTPEVLAALQARAEHPSGLVREHVAWALERHRKARQNAPGTATSGSP